jgi:hypothetical protein
MIEFAYIMTTFIIYHGNILLSKFGMDLMNKKVCKVLLRHRYNYNICNCIFALKQMTLASKRVDNTRSYINKSDVH